MPLAEFRRIVYPVARHIDARIVAMQEAGATPNFHVALLDAPERLGEPGRVCLLYSTDYDAWAAALPARMQGEPDVDGSQLYEPRYLDHEGMMTAMAELHGIALWTSYELAQPVPADFPQRVRGDLAYWRPQRLGDALFNGWD